MEDMALYPRKRYLMGVMNTLCCAITHILNLIIAPVLVFLAADFGVDTATAGYASTLHVLAQGIFILISPVMISWIDNKKTQIIGMAIMAAGALMSYFAPSFTVLLISRFISGMGHGICSGCSTAIIAAWFPPKEKSIFVTVNSLGVVAVTTLTYTCAVPLYHAFGGSWRMLLMALGIVLIVLNIAWIILYRDNHAQNEYIRAKNLADGKVTNPFSGIREAVSRRDVWLLWLFMGTSTIAANGINTYLPQFLQNVRGFSDASASSVVGIASGVSAAATLLGGVFTTAIGRRKIIIIPTVIFGSVFLAASLISGSPMAICALYILYTMCTNFRGPAQGTITTELKNVTPALTSSAASISFGIGFIGTSLTSPMLRMSTNLFGEEYSMLIYVPLFILSLIFAAMLPETGPGRAARAKKSNT